MAYTNGWYDNWESDECSDDSLSGECDGYIPDDDKDAPGAECRCLCHGEGLNNTAEVTKWHSDKHRDAQDGAYHDLPYHY